MLHGKIFRSTVAHGRISRIDVSAARAHRRRVSRHHHRGRAQGHPESVSTARRSTISRSWPLDKVRYVGEPVAVVLADDPHVAEQAAQLIAAEYEELPAVFDEVEAMTSTVDRARRAEARRHLRRSQASARARRTPTSRSTSICGAATWTTAFATAEHVFEHTFRTQQVLHVPLEPFVSRGRADRRPG